jgi:uncharacterized protein (DUF4415 family)
MSRKVKLHIPTPEEDAEIQHGIDADPDTFVPTDEQFARMKRRGRGPQKAPTKQAITVRYDEEVIERFRASGDGWQSRMNAALREWLKTHEPDEVNV